MSGGFDWRAMVRRHAWQVVCLTLLGGQTQVGHGATLSSLLAGGTLDIANSRASQWQVLQADSTAGAIDFAQIQVNPLVTTPTLPSILFQPGTQLSTSGINAIDLVLRFRVDALAGASTFNGQSLQLTSHSFDGAGGIVVISSEMSDGIAADLGSTVVNADEAANVLQLTDAQAFGPKSQLFVTMNVFVTGTATGDVAAIGSFVQQLTQTGPPGKPGDYNQNGTVDAADYTVWRNKAGAPAGTLPNDTAGGVIGTAQYNLWKANFGLAGSGSLAVAAVPEAATGWSLTAILFAAGEVLPRRCRRFGLI